MLGGVALDDAAPYQVAVNNFLAEGGDRFPLFLSGRERIDTGVRDIDALMDYLARRERIGMPAGSAAPAGRIRRVK